MPQITDYAAEDALVPVRLQPILARRMEEESLVPLFRDVEMPLIDVLVELEYNGVKIDVQRLAELSRNFGEQMQRLEQEIYVLAGREFNIASPRQLQDILFVEQKLPVIKRTAKTGPSTDVDVLEELAQKHPLPAKIVEYRQYAKLKGTYVDALPQMVNPRTGRVHASFNQVVTATGRLSSHDPNLQNIPVRTEAGRAIRSAFVPGEEGWTLVAADYSQIELRVLAHYTADERLCEAFQRDEDIHARVAGQVNNVPLEQVTEDMRRQAKVVNFGTIYGQGAVGLSRQLGIDRQTAAKFINSYFETYPGIERFLIESLAECRKQGYVTTILGRRRAIEGVRADAGRSRNMAERTAVNTIIQGSAADLMKLAMIAVFRRLKREQHPARMLLQIHDELIFEAPAEQVGLLGSTLAGRDVERLSASRAAEGGREGRAELGRCERDLMKILGLLGGVASGKSLVARQLAELGAVVLDADRAGHEALRLPRIEEAARQRWGDAVFGPDGHIDRSRLAKIVFAPPPDGPRERKYLEELTHPEIGRRLSAQAEALKTRFGEGLPTRRHVRRRSPIRRETSVGGVARSETGHNSRMRP